MSSCSCGLSSNEPDTLATGSNPLNEGKEIFKSDIVQTLLDQLPKPEIQTPWVFSFPIAKKFKDQGRNIIAGYASVEVIDSQNELIPIPVLKEAWVDFKKNKDFYFGSLMHTNIPVFKILDKYEDSDKQIWKSGVDDNGLFIVGEIRQDIEKGKQTWQGIEDGRYTGFSIGGEALASSTVCEGKCFTRIEKMELHEVAIVDRPANQPSVFKILKGERLRKLAELSDTLPNMIISPGVTKLAGSTAELGKGHDFDLLITAKKGSFIDRAIQTRIYNELRKQGRLDLWNDIHIIHEPSGLGPFTDYYDLHDLVILRSPLKKKEMVMKPCPYEEEEERKKADFDISLVSLEKIKAILESINVSISSCPVNKVIIKSKLKELDIALSHLL